MTREANLVNYLPDFLQSYKELIAVLQAQEPEIQRMEDITETIKNSSFILYCDIWGIEKFEGMLGIKPLDGDLLENRKFRILSSWNNSVPYTVRTLRENLETLCGKDGYELTVLPERYTVIVRIALKSKRNFETVRDMMNEMIPANMVLNLSLLYNQHQTLSKFTHGQLSAYTHRQLREELLEDGK